MRECVARQVQQTTRAPQLFQWAKSSLGGKHLLLCQGKTLYGARGVQQRSPLGPLFFSLALREVLVKLPLDDASWKIWYLDATIFGSLELLEQVSLHLEQNLPRIGLGLNLRKCVLVSLSPPENNRFPAWQSYRTLTYRDHPQSRRMQSYISILVPGRRHPLRGRERRSSNGAS